MQTMTVKQSLKSIVDSMPENSTWDDVMYEIYVRQKIDKGFEDIKKGKVLSHDKVKQLLKLK